MGLIVNNTIDLPIGIKKSNCYFSFYSEPIYILRNDDKRSYTLWGNCSIYYDQTARNKKSEPLHKMLVSLNIEEADLSTNPYELLYNELKNKYFATMDV